MSGGLTLCRQLRQCKKKSTSSMQEEVDKLVENVQSAPENREILVSRLSFDLNSLNV